MTLGRSLAAVVYVLSTLTWAGIMVLSRALLCDGGCTPNQVDHMDATVVLGFIGLAIATAALFGSVVRLWLGLALLWCHALVFAINLALFWGLADSAWVFLVPAALTAAAGHVAVGAHRVDSGQVD